MTLRWIVTDKLFSMKLTWGRLNMLPVIGNDGGSAMCPYDPQRDKDNLSKKVQQQHPKIF